MNVKKFLAISTLVLGTLGAYFGYESFNDNLDLPEVLKYVESHPEHNEEIINYSIRCKINDEIPYSGSTLKTFSEVVLYQAIQNQFYGKQHMIKARDKGNTEEALTRQNQHSLLDKLTPEEKWAIIKEGIFYGSKSMVDGATEIGFDFYEKIKEAKFYESIGEKR